MTEPFFIDSFFRDPHARRGYVGPPAVEDVDSHTGPRPVDAVVNRRRRQTEEAFKAEQKQKNKRTTKTSSKWLLPPPHHHSHHDTQSQEEDVEDIEQPMCALPEDEESAEESVSEESVSEESASEEWDSEEWDSDDEEVLSLSESTDGSKAPNVDKSNGSDGPSVPPMKYNYIITWAICYFAEEPQGSPDDIDSDGEFVC